jgi:hypothetical protein
VKIIKYQSDQQNHFKFSDPIVFFLAITLLLTLPKSAEAYIGPGAGIGTIGTAIAFLGALILLVVGFVWYPVKRLLRRLKAGKNQKGVDKS